MQKARGHILKARVHKTPWKCQLCGQAYRDMELMFETMDECRGGEGAQN